MRQPPFLMPIIPFDIEVLTILPARVFLANIGNKTEYVPPGHTLLSTGSSRGGFRDKSSTRKARRGPSVHRLAAWYSACARCHPYPHASVASHPCIGLHTSVRIQLCIPPDCLAAYP